MLFTCKVIYQQKRRLSLSNITYLSRLMIKQTKWLCAQRRKLGSLATHWAHSEDSDQTGWMPRLIWVFAGRTLILLVLSCGGSFQWCTIHTCVSKHAYTDIVSWYWKYLFSGCNYTFLLPLKFHKQVMRKRNSVAIVLQEKLAQQSISAACWKDGQ